MPWELFESLVKQISDPRIFLLNYSGESTVYPHLIPAIRLARSTGARVELVTALASVPYELLGALSSSGLTRLTVSVHAAEDAAYSQIYGHSSFAELRARLEVLTRLSEDGPVIDLAFVAMRQNLDQLRGVAELAAGLGLRAISVFPVIRRDPIPMVFASELSDGVSHRAEFREDLTGRVEDVRRAFPEVALEICNPMFSGSTPALGEMPRPCPGSLPVGARIYSCEQNPWETVHILANGDVSPCEVHDRTVLGNLARQTLEEIWEGADYRRWRQRYQLGKLAECRSCPWKTAYFPGPGKSEIVAERGLCSQMGHGWHAPDAEAHIWSSQQATAWIEPRAGSRELHVNGMLPSGPGAADNQLSVRCNGATVGTITNSSAEMLPFGVDFAVPESAARLWNIEFRTRFVYRPNERGMGTDQRDLGFALRFLSSHPPVNRVLAARGRLRMRPVMATLRRLDRLGRALQIRRFFPVEWKQSAAAGVSVVIPERDNIEELTACLAGVRAAARHSKEPMEVLVVVNGAAPEGYRKLQALFPEMRWQFHALPLGFAGAVKAGVWAARYPWVYLLNSDIVLEEDALTAACGHRDPGVFSVASQIFPKDPTRFRDETNLTKLFVEDGLATIHDLIPGSAETVEHCYAGGGASLFQTRLLRRLLDAPAYHPFYWEDVEWGWRARKLGYRSLFCAASVAHHTQKATIGRCYSREEIGAIVERNRLLFQLRNFTTAGSLDAVMEAIANQSAAVIDYFSDSRTLRGAVRGRLWNWAAPVPDEELLGGARSQEPEARRMSGGGDVATRAWAKPIHM